MTLAELVEEFLSYLNSSPGSFETDIEHMVNMLNSWVTTEETLQELVELIYTQVCVSTHTHGSVIYVLFHFIAILYCSLLYFVLVSFKKKKCMFIFAVYCYPQFLVHWGKAL